jgi:hypothetical protein
MTLAVETGDVLAVLLADGWHDVEPGSFTVQRLAFVDAEGVKQPKAARRPGYRFLEQCRSLGAVRTVVVAGPLKAILAVRTAAQEIPAGERPTSAPQSVPDPSGPEDRRPAESPAPAPQSVPDPSGPEDRRPAESPAPAPESVPASPPEREPDDAGRSVQASASVPESPGRFAREAERPSAPFQASSVERMGPVAANLPDVPARPESSAPRPSGAPAHPPPQTATSWTQMAPSVLLRDEMERDRLARAGLPVSEGPPPETLGLGRVAGRDDDDLDG